MQKIIFIFIVVGLWSCENVSVPEVKNPVYKKEKPKPVSKVEKKTVPKINLLPFFTQEFNDDDFISFYHELVRNCQQKDTTAVLNSIADTLRFSKYECAYGQVYQNNSCENCIRCTKKGMLEGIFPNSNNDAICEKLLELISKYGIGPITKNKAYYSWLKIDTAYLNYNFIHNKDFDRYFDYRLIFPNKEGVEIKEKPNLSSTIIGKVNLKTYEYDNEPGMGIMEKSTEINWLEFQNGYINSNEIETGFDFTLVIFEKMHSGWKITGFIQPPGC